MKVPLRFVCTFLYCVHFSSYAALPVVEVEGQPLSANVARLIRALEFLGAPLAEEETKKLNAAIRARDAGKIQQLLDPHVLVAVSLNPEVRVKVRRRRCSGRAGSRRLW